MNYRTERLPIVTLSLIGLNTLVYLVSLFFYFTTGGESELWILRHLWLIPADWHWYCSFTYMFVHAGIFHLFGNMLFLFLFGSCVEDMIGRVRFAALLPAGRLRGGNGFHRHVAAAFHDAKTRWAARPAPSAPAWECIFCCAPMPTSSSGISYFSSCGFGAANFPCRRGWPFRFGF